jgi:hypothetical protein
MAKIIKKLREFPAPISLLKLMGPSFVLLALGLGSGELILWPYLVANYGLGIAWGAALGITFQYFMNMEIERYALVKGESVFVGFAKIFKWAPYWFIISTFVGFGLPGIIASSAQILAHLLGLSDFKLLAIALLLFIGIILSVGKTVYGMMERITKTIIFIGVPIVFILTFYLVKNNDVWELFKGLAGQGHGFNWLPSGISLATFLAAFAYAGAGGNLNLTQSIYVKEKGYGMGKYSQKISGLFAKRSGAQNIKLSGENFVANAENIANFHKWWRRISLEHLFVFWLVGLTAICLLMLLSYVTAYGQAGNAQGINFIINEALQIGRQLAPVVGSLFLLVVGVMLFQTQLGIMDSTSRIMAENSALKQMEHKQTNKIKLSKIYYIFVWSQIAFGILLFSFNIYEPKTLIVAGAVINAVAMFVHVGLTLALNRRSLGAPFRPRIWRQLMMLIIFLIFGLFSGVTLWNQFF